MCLQFHILVLKTEKSINPLYEIRLCDKNFKPVVFITIFERNEKKFTRSKCAIYVLPVRVYLKNIFTKI